MYTKPENYLILLSEILCPSALSTDTLVHGLAPSCSKENKFGSSCTFQCSNGYALSSSTPVVCTGTSSSAIGSWDSSAPTCSGK